MKAALSFWPGARRGVVAIGTTGAATAGAYSSTISGSGAPNASEGLLTLGTFGLRYLSEGRTKEGDALIKKTESDQTDDNQIESLIKEMKKIKKNLDKQQNQLALILSLLQRERS